jgi:hypothetical protein
VNNARSRAFEGRAVDAGSGKTGEARRKDHGKVGAVVGLTDHRSVNLAAITHELIHAGATF